MSNMVSAAALPPCMTTNRQLVPHDRSQQGARLSSSMGPDLDTVSCTSCLMKCIGLHPSEWMITSRQAARVLIDPSELSVKSKSGERTSCKKWAVWIQQGCIASFKTFRRPAMCRRHCTVHPQHDLQDYVTKWLQMCFICGSDWLQCQCSIMLRCQLLSGWCCAQF